MVCIFWLAHESYFSIASAHFIIYIAVTITFIILSYVNFSLLGLLLPP